MTNVGLLTRNAIVKIPDRAPITAPGSSSQRVERWIVAVLVASVLGLTARWSMTRLVRSVRDHWPCWVALGIAIPALLSAKLVGWRGHYVLPLYLIVLLLLGVALHQGRPLAGPVKVPLLALLGGAIMAVLPGHPKPGGLGPSVRALTRQHQRHAVRMLELGTLAAFLPTDVFRINGCADPRSVTEWLSRQGSNVVYFEDMVRVPRRVGDDPAWQQSLISPGLFGFREVSAEFGRLSIREEKPMENRPGERIATRRDA